MPLFPSRGPLPGGPGRGGDLQALSIPGYCIQLRQTNQTILQSVCIPQFGDSEAAPGPKLPATVTLPAASNSDDGDRVKFFTTGATSGGDRYRIRASVEPSAPNRILLIAAPLNSVDSTLHRLLLIELLVTAIALIAMTVVGLWVIRIGLKPLDAMGKTAAAIAAGDLSQRVEEDDRTEVGRLGLALNSMLAHIEEAVSALEASESKLRRFVADASHELRTPLAAVRAYAELFTRGAASRPDDLERSMKGISRESERMSVLVDDLLLLAHLDEGRPLTLEPIAFEDVVAEAIETARTLEPDRPLEADLTPSTVLGDHDRLRQVDRQPARERPRSHPARCASERDPRPRSRRPPCWRSPTRAPAWTRRPEPTSSSASTAPTPPVPAPAAARASASRSSTQSSRRTAGRSRSSRSPARERRSACASRSLPRRSHRRLIGGPYGRRSTPAKGASLKRLKLLVTGTATLVLLPATAQAATGPQLWSQAGCGGCHTLNAAGSTGRNGPNLDSLRPSASAVASQVTYGGGGMPSFGGSLSSSDIQALASWVSQSAGGSRRAPSRRVGSRRPPPRAFSAT